MGLEGLHHRGQASGRSQSGALELAPERLGDFGSVTVKAPLHLRCSPGTDDDRHQGRMAQGKRDGGIRQRDPESLAHVVRVMQVGDSDAVQAELDEALVHGPTNAVGAEVELAPDDRRHIEVALNVAEVLAAGLGTSSRPTLVERTKSSPFFEASSAPKQRPESPTS